ncbi:MAG: elongation factor G [Pirellulales bacterium]
MSQGTKLRRNIAFCGHSDAGKTTLLDQLLVQCGAATGAHSVDNGTSICDFDAEEILHHHTIETKLVHLQHQGHFFNLLDTPGYPDFIGQTVEALEATDCAAICIHAHAGIEVNTRRVFREASDCGIGRILVITRLDADHIDFEELWQSIQSSFGSACCLMNIPDHVGPTLSRVTGVFDDVLDRALSSSIASMKNGLIERVVEADEEWMERYFEGEVPSDDEVQRLVPQAVLRGTLIPVFCTAARSGVGLLELLNGLVWAAPSPEQMDRHAIDSDGNDVRLPADADGPLVARVFKNRIDPFVQKLSFIRIYSGSLAKDQSVHLCDQHKDLKMSPILDVQASHTHAIDHAEAGDIVAVAKMEDLHIGTTLGDYHLPDMHFPTPMVGVAVAPKGHNDENKLFNALHKLVEEDPTLKIERDAQTSQLVMTGMSEFHLSLIRERLQRRDHLEIEVSDPKIPLRETVMTQSEGSYRHKKQSGGRGQFGEVHLRVMPLARGTVIAEFATKERFPQMKQYHHDPQINFLWIDSIVGGSIPSNFMPAVEKGVRERMAKGVYAGYPIQDIVVEVFYGKHHPVDSSEAAFKIAGAQAFREVFMQAQPCLLEPIVHLQVTLPELCVGDLYGEISIRGGRVHGSEPGNDGWHSVSCEAPLRTVLHFGRVLSNFTGGQGVFTMEGSRFELMPANVQHEYRNGKVQEEDEVLA